MTGLIRATVNGLVDAEGLAASLPAEFAAITWRGPRARAAAVPALAVAIAVVLAMAVHLEMPWWAGISGLMASQATLPGSLQRAGLRILGTATGATSAVLLSPLLVHDHVTTSLFLFCAAFIGMLGSMLSGHAYAWLFFAITFCLVVLLSLTDPAHAFRYAVYRFIEVVLGSGSALVAAMLLLPATEAAPADSPPGMRDLLGVQYPAVLHAVRSGIVVMLLPWVWSWIAVPGLAQMAVTVASVMSVPVLSDHPLTQGRKIAGRALQRLLGCAVGGIGALAVLRLSLTDFVFWLPLLVGGVWLAAWLQGSTRGVSYIGAQAGIVFIISTVQGWGPPDSLLPGISRIVGMTVGIALLFVVSLLFWPEDRPA